jgi:hypothetical protein
VVVRKEATARLAQTRVPLNKHLKAYVIGIQSCLSV